MTEENGRPAELLQVGRFHHAIRVLEEFDCAEVRGVAKGQLAPTDREQCIFGTYYRAALNVSSLVALNDPRHFQAIAQLARTLLELAVDLRLFSIVENATEKMLAFSELERLKSAREAVSLRGSTSDSDDLAAQFIANNEERITARREELWSGVKRLDHWSAMDLRQRVEALKGSHEELYKQNYRRLSWYVHPGLTGVLNFEASAFEAVAGDALQVAAECYEDILRVVIAELQLSKINEKIYKKLEVARVLAFTENPKQANELWREKVGD